MLEVVVAPLSRQYQSKETLAEITQVFLNELDYGLEAENTDLFRRLSADLPDVVIPHVYHSLSTRRVLTNELMGGIGYEEFRQTANQEQRNRAGKTIWTFMMRSLLKHGVLYADPHPGNYRFLDDGRVAFLDFGCVKRLPAEMVDGLKGYMAAVMDANWAEFDRLCAEFMGMDPSDKKSWDLYRSYTLELLIPIATNAAFECTPESAREAVQYLVRGHRKLIKEAEGGPRLPAPMRMPFDLTFVNRLQWGLASIMGGLGTRARFRELTEPWVRCELEPRNIMNGEQRRCSRPARIVRGLVCASLLVCACTKPEPRGHTPATSGSIPASSSSAVAVGSNTRTVVDVAPQDWVEAGSPRTMEACSFVDRCAAQRPEEPSGDSLRARRGWRWN